jgi:hypothetical protein
MMRGLAGRDAGFALHTAADIHEKCVLLCHEVLLLDGQ